MADIDVTVFRVQAMHYEGPTAAGGRSDKVWAAILLKRPSADGRTFCYVSVWGPTRGTMRITQHAWTGPLQATKEYDKNFAKQTNEGYDNIEWTDDRWGMASTIRRLERSVPASVANGDAARKAWRTRRETPAEKRANDALASVKLSEDKPPPKPTPPADGLADPLARMRRRRVGLEDMLRD